MRAGVRREKLGTRAGPSVAVRGWTRLGWATPLSLRASCKISAPEPLSIDDQAAQQKAKELLLLIETHQITPLNAGDQVPEIEKPLEPVMGEMQKNRFLAPYRYLTERTPILPSRSNMRQRSLSLNNNPTRQIAGRGWLPYRSATEAMRQSRSLVPYSGERLPDWPAAFRSRPGSAPVITLMDNIAGREMMSLLPSGERMRQSSSLILSFIHCNNESDWHPPLVTSEQTLMQRTNLNSDTTESEREQSRQDTLETRENTSLVPYDFRRQRQPLWHDAPEMFQSSPIIVLQIDPSSGREMVTLPIP